MSLLPQRLMRRLARTRLATGRAIAAMGTGERPSSAKGGGVEFTDHRPYQVGDDIRHLDQHLHARLGEYFVREFGLDQQIPVVVLIDASRSMEFGRPPKMPYAASLAAAVGYAALAGGDRVQVAAFGGDDVRWSPRFDGSWRAAMMFDWLERLRPDGDTPIDGVLRGVVPRLHPHGVLVVVSDFLFDGVEQVLASLAAANQEVVGLQVLSPDEVEPERLGSGPARLMDAETGREIEVSLDAASYERYRSELDLWQRRLREQHVRHRWRFLQARSDEDVESVVMVAWRRAGLLV